jgi:hypothetical protein
VLERQRGTSRKKARTKMSNRVFRHDHLGKPVQREVRTDVVAPVAIAFPVPSTVAECDARMQIEARRQAGAMVARIGLRHGRRDGLEQGVSDADLGKLEAAAHDQLMAIAALRAKLQAAIAAQPDTGAQPDDVMDGSEVMRRNREKQRNERMGRVTVDAIAGEDPGDRMARNREAQRLAAIERGRGR